MGQAEVMEILERSDNWLAAREVSEVLMINRSTTNLLLRKLYDQGEVLRRMKLSTYRHGRNWNYEYKIK